MGSSGWNWSGTSELAANKAIVLIHCQIRRCSWNGPLLLRYACVRIASLLRLIRADYRSSIGVASTTCKAEAAAGHSLANRCLSVHGNSLVRSTNIAIRTQQPSGCRRRMPCDTESGLTLKCGSSPRSAMCRQLGLGCASETTRDEFTPRCSSSIARYPVTRTGQSPLSSRQGSRPVVAN